MSCDAIDVYIHRNDHEKININKIKKKRKLSPHCIKHAFWSEKHKASASANSIDHRT